MKTEMKICGLCHRPLPIDQFRLATNGSTRDTYCHDCRREYLTMHRKMKRLQPENPLRTLITTTAEPELRMKLILHARQLVRDRVMRKRQLLKQAECMEYANEWHADDAD